MIQHSYFSLPRLLCLALVCLFPRSVEATIHTYVLDESGNQLTFSAHSTGHDFQGETAQLAGRFSYEYESGEPSTSGEVRIQVQELHTGIGLRDRKMYQLFNADQYPQIAFRLERLPSVKIVAPQTYTARLIGQLSIKGVTREVPVEISATLENNQIHVTGNTHLRMTDFGISPPGFLFFHVSDAVQVTFRLNGKAV